MEDSVACRAERLRAGKPTKSQRVLLDYFERTDNRCVLRMSITELANATGLADATVLRFCRSLGFGGFQEFKLRLAQDAAERRTAVFAADGFVSKLASDYRDALEGCESGVKREILQTVCDCILSSRTVCCLGAGRSYLAALEFYNRLTKMGIESRSECDPLAQRVLLASRTAQDVAVLFSVSGETRTTVDAAELARASGVKIIVITCNGNSPLTRFADAVFCVPFPAPRDTDAVAGRLMQFFAIDAICEALRSRDRARFDEFIAKGNVAVSGK